MCREGACERPSPTELALAWERPGYVHFDGLLDGDGNLYLNELRLDGGYALLSLTPAGAERYRVPYPEDAPETPEAVFGSLLISRVPVGLNRFEYRARRTADAAVVWTSTLTDVLGEHVDQPPASMRPKVLSVSSVHEAKGGHLGVMVVGWLQHPDGHLESADLLRAEIDAFTGALRKVVRVGDNYGTAIARLGGDFVVSDGNEVRAFTSEGATAWTTSPSAEQHVLASSGSALIVGKDGPDCMGSGGNFQWSLEVRDSSTGTVRGSPPLTGKWETHRAPPLVANEGQSWVIGQPAFPAGTSCDQLGEHGLYKLDLQSGTILGQYPLDWPLGATRGTCSWLSTPQLGLTNRNSLLAFSFVQSCSNEPRWFVREFSRAGVQSWTCRVGTPQDPYQTQFTFTHGHLVPHSTYGSVEGLRAYVLPGYGPATRGWSGDRGNPQQTSVERP